MKKSIKVLISVPAALLLIFIGSLLFFTVIAYRPEEKIPLQAMEIPAVPDNSTPGDLSILSWNIGYAGLDMNSDFILDGGETSHPESREAVIKALAGISDFLEKKEADIYFLQETDQNSARTFNIDQTAMISSLLPAHYSWYAPNYKALFVPFPFSSPLGKIESGIMTLSRYQSSENIRYQLPGQYSWPVRVFHLSRCALLTRIPSATSGKDWCLFNLHLTAYGDGSMRREQLEYLKVVFKRLYEEGHYVVAGGDWNSLFPGVEMTDFTPYTTEEKNLGWIQNIPEEWTPEGWQWCYDPKVPSVRTLDQPFQRGENLETIIDGFLISPNLELREIRGTDLLFENSDHNPVSITVRAVD